MNELNLLGLIFIVAGNIIAFISQYTANKVDKYRFQKWGEHPRSDGSLNFKIRWSKLDKLILLAYSIIFIGVILQIFGYLYD